MLSALDIYKHFREGHNYEVGCCSVHRPLAFKSDDLGFSSYYTLLLIYVPELITSPFEPQCLPVNNMYNDTFLGR